MASAKDAGPCALPVIAISCFYGRLGGDMDTFQGPRSESEILELQSCKPPTLPTFLKTLETPSRAWAALSFRPWTALFQA